MEKYGIAMADLLAPERPQEAQGTKYPPVVMTAALDIAQTFMDDSTKVWPAGDSPKEAAARRGAETMAREAGLPNPKVFISDSKQSNMVVSGDIVVISNETLKKTPAEEVESVVMHEIGHELKRDSALSVMAQRAKAAVQAFASKGHSGWKATWQLVKDACATSAAHVFAFVPGVWKNYVSRREEHHADRKAVEFGADPNALASGLKRMHTHNEEIGGVDKAMANSGIRAAVDKIRHTFNRIRDDHPDIDNRGHRIAMAALAAAKKQNRTSIS